jgi:hypothetical protein
MSRCGACNHPDRPKLDVELLRGKSIRKAAAEFTLSKSCVARHRAEHLSSVLAKATSKLEQKVEVEQAREQLE